MNKHDLFDHIEYESDVDKTKIRELYGRKFTVTAYRGDDVTGIGEFDNIHDMSYRKDKLYISNTCNITIAPGEVVEKEISTELDINLDYTFRMLDNNETFEMRDLITKKSNYVFKTDVIEIGDFIRFKRIYSQGQYHSGTAIITDVETYKLEMMVFNNTQYQYIDIWPLELYVDGQDFEFEIIAKHEYVENHNIKPLYVFSESDDVEDEDEEAVDVLDETE
jgi:hypothetical protein